MLIIAVELSESTYALLHLKIEVISIVNISVMLLCNSLLMETHPTMLKAIRASEKMVARRMIASKNAPETLLSHS